MQDLQEQILTLLNVEFYPKSKVDESLKTIRNKTTVWPYNENVQDLIDFGIVQIITEVLIKRDISQESTVNILWALTNVCAGTSNQTQLVINLSGLDHFRKFCENQSFDIAIQALWGIGNIACETKLRLNLLDKGCVQMVCDFLDRPETNKHIGVAIWVLSNLTRGNPKVPYNKVSSSLPYLIKCLNQQDENTMMIDALWSLVRLSDYKESHETFVNNDITFYLKALKSNSFKVIVPAVRIFGNLAFGDDVCVRHLLQNDCVHWAIKLYQQNRHNYTILIEVVWSLSHFVEQHQEYLLNLLPFRQMIDELFEQQQLYSGIFKKVYLIMRNLSRNRIACQEVINQQWHIKWIKNKDRFIQQQIKEPLMEYTFLEGINNMANNIPVAFDESLIEIIKQQIEWSSKNFKQREVKQQQIQIASTFSYIIQKNTMEQEDEDDNEESYSYDNESMSTKPS